MRYLLILILSLSFALAAVGQDEWKARDWNIKVAYSYQKYQVIDIGFGKLGQPVYMGSCGTDPMGGDGFSLSMQAYFRPHYSPLYAPTLSWEASFLYDFKGIIEASYITNFKNADIYITPKIGLNLYSLYVVYGYSFGLSNNLKNIGLSNSNITVGVDIPISTKNYDSIDDDTN